MIVKGKKRAKLLMLMLSVSAVAGCNSAMTTAEIPLQETIPLAYFDQYLDLAEQAIQHKKYEDAKRFLEKTLLRDPDNSRAKLLLAEMQFSRGQMNLAGLSFKRLMDNVQVKAKALQGYGLVLLKSHQEDEAVSYLKQATALDPGLWRAWNGLGYYYDHVQDWQKSEASYGHAITLRPDRAILYNNRGFSRLLQKKMEGAIADLLKAIQLAPDNTLARLNLQLALATAGEYGQAMSLEAQDTSANGLNNVGYVALLKGDYSNAESFLTQAMATSYWFHEKAWKNLGLLHSLNEETDKAAGTPSKE